LSPGDEASEFDELIRRVDPDRWLTSRFIADAEARTDVLALYAFDHELARARRAASTPLMSEIRLTWWREMLDEAFEGRPVRRHPTALALAAAVARRGLPRAPLEAMVDGQIDILGAAVLDAASALRWADQVHGSAAGLAAQTLGGQPRHAAPAGRVWGLAQAVRAGLIDPDAARPLLADAVRAAREAARQLPAAAFPAALPARLAAMGVASAPVARRLALILAVATGRL
jgi:phytoene synthase